MQETERANIGTNLIAVCRVGVQSHSECESMVH